MITVGVTGGIGSGKSTVCRVWEKMGAVVVYADQLAQELMVRDEYLIEGIRMAFGEQAYNPDGSLNRPYLAKEAFQKGRVNVLNSLVHPAVKKCVKIRMEQAEKMGAEMFAEEAALLLEYGRPPEFSFIVIVSAPKDQRLVRVRQRDSATREEVLARMNRQKTFEDLMPLSDFIIENHSSLEDLESKAADLFRKMLKLQKTGLD